MLKNFHMFLAKLGNLRFNVAQTAVALFAWVTRKMGLSQLVPSLLLHMSISTYVLPIDVVIFSTGRLAHGKSSLVRAIAGVFGLNIYCISLVEPSLTKKSVGLIFSNLPRRCTVLLEDIESSGLTKRRAARRRTLQWRELDDKTQLDCSLNLSPSQINLHLLILPQFWA